MTIERVGMLGLDGKLVHVSDCNSMVGSEFDGPVLWSTVEEAQKENDFVGGVPAGNRFAKVIITVVGGIG